MDSGVTNQRMANVIGNFAGMQHPVRVDLPRPSSVGSSHSSSSSRHYGTPADKKRGGKAAHNDICVGEELKIAVGIALERFRLSEEQKVHEFPSSLTAQERFYIHKLCASLGLKSKSKGKGPNRYLSVSKKDGSQNMHTAAALNLSRKSRHQVVTMLQRFPVTNKERQDLQPRTERGQYHEGMCRELNKTTTGRLNNGVPQIPPSKGNSDLTAFCQTLPVFFMRDTISKAIQENKVVMVAGETGSGKTTQVPQIILDDCHSQGRPCRVFCTQPRRLSALSIAERVAGERGEKVGQAVGYQIRLESRVSPKTVLTFCTNGVLLRTLMGGENSLSTVTHVIVDEIHERDRFSDFLLIALRDLMPKYKNLRVILMSATLNTQLFCRYFAECPILTVPGKLFDVQAFFLEDVLKLTGYTNREMEKYKKESKKVSSQQKELDDWCNQQLAEDPLKELDDDEDAEDEQLPHDIEALSLNSTTENKIVQMGEEKEELEPWLVAEMDRALSEVWLSGKEDLFNQIFHLILSENVSVDVMHSETSATPLMIATGRGFYNVVEQLLSLGANVNTRASNDWTALDWARKFERGDILELLESHVATSQEVRHDEELLVKQSETLTDEDRELLNVYHHSFDDEKVDLELILALMHKIHSGSQEGAVLVFLPGYDEIVTLRDCILEDKRFNVDSNRYILYTLHSQMQSSDQRRVFKNPAPGVRKIILSTNLAETSITINDVVFVIDSGKVKEKSFDALTSVSQLKAHWVSKASATQRRGRAGRCRPGVCYHLFSSIRYDYMPEFADPEILRYPLQELCLHTKLLAPANCPIADFLAKAPEPPAFLISRNAVHLLKQMDALDPFEDLTELGHHLADLPVEPRYGKMILYSVVLKCLDPVLTIACSLAYRDPFVLPAQPYRKRAAAMTRRKFSSGTCSDHMALLRAFQAWQKARTESWEKSFCEKNFLSSATMEMIVGMRTQLLGQLRASGFVRARGGGDIRDLNTNSENWAVVKAALVAGMYPHVCRVDRDHLQLNTVKETKVRFHTSSVLSASPNEIGPVGPQSHRLLVHALPTDWLVYEEMTRAHRLARIRVCTSVSPVTVAVFGGPAKLSHDAVHEAEGMGHMGQGDVGLDISSDSEGEEKEDGRKTYLRLDDWISFRGDSEVALLAVQLRQKWHSLLIRRMRTPAKPWSQVDENVIRTVVSVLTNEEQLLGLQQPAGIGQRPRPMATDNIVSSGGSRRGSNETEYSDDSSSGNNDFTRQTTPTKGRAFKFQATPPRKRDMGFNRSVEDRSETSSVRSSGSNPGSSSTGNSATNSLRGSSASSPCDSPVLHSPGAEGGATVSASLAPSSPSGPCCCFVMKSNSYKNLDVSIQRGIWATSPPNEKRLERALKEGKVVYLVFSVQGSGHFQGYARVASPVTGDKCREFSGHSMGRTFTVEWCKRANLPFQHCHHLHNPWNENKKVQISRDGQELEPGVGETLLRLWDKLPPYQAKTSPQFSKSPLQGYHDQGSPGGGQGQGHEGGSSPGGSHNRGWGQQGHRSSQQGPWPAQGGHGQQYAPHGGYSHHAHPHHHGGGGGGGGGGSGGAGAYGGRAQQQGVPAVHSSSSDSSGGGGHPQAQFSPVFASTASTPAGQTMSPVMILQRSSSASSSSSSVAPSSGAHAGQRGGTPNH